MGSKALASQLKRFSEASSVYAILPSARLATYTAAIVSFRLLAFRGVGGPVDSCLCTFLAPVS
jgi:hypothetical protein